MSSAVACIQQSVQDAEFAAAPDEVISARWNLPGNHFTGRRGLVQIYVPVDRPSLDDRSGNRAVDSVATPGLAHGDRY